MIDAIAVVLAIALVATTVWFLRRRDDVVNYSRTDATTNRVGRTWMRSRHGGR